MGRSWKRLHLPDWKGDRPPAFSADGQSLFMSNRVQFQAKADAPRPQVRDEAAICWRFEGGIPQLTLDQLRLEANPFARLVGQISGILVFHNRGWQGEVVDRAPEELIALAQEVFDTWDSLTAPGIDSEPKVAEESHSGHLTALAVAFALAPYLQRASDAILPRLDLGGWRRGNCPICGGRPNFALLDAESGARSLMCSRCDSLWPFSRIVCPFCTGEDRPMYYSSEHGVHRLYVCSRCKSYLKAVDLRKVRRVVNPLVERLVTIGMDLAAHEEGYRG
jgi:uncharacterized protein YbaR (Trm112 family)